MFKLLFTFNRKNNLNFTQSIRMGLELLKYGAQIHFLELDSTLVNIYFGHMEKSSLDMQQSIFICVLQKKESKVFGITLKSWQNYSF